MGMGGWEERLVATLAVPWATNPPASVTRSVIVDVNDPVHYCPLD